MSLGETIPNDPAAASIPAGTVANPATTESPAVRARALSGTPRRTLKLKPTGLSLSAAPPRAACGAQPATHRLDDESVRTRRLEDSKTRRLEDSKARRLNHSTTQPLNHSTTQPPNHSTTRRPTTLYPTAPTRRHPFFFLSPFLSSSLHRFPHIISSKQTRPHARVAYHHQPNGRLCNPLHVRHASDRNVRSVRGPRRRAHTRIDLRSSSAAVCLSSAAPARTPDAPTGRLADFPNPTRLCQKSP